MWRSQQAQNCPNLVRVQDHRHPFSGRRTYDVFQPRQIHFQNMPIQEENAVQGLILGTRRNMTVNGQMTQERLDRLLPQP